MSNCQIALGKHVPQRNRTKCYFGGGEIDVTADGNFERVMGWCKNRSAGGSNAVAVPERLNVWACSRCIERETQGLTRQSVML